MSRGALTNHMLNNTGEKRVLGFVTSVKIVNIFCVVVHKSEERLVQVSDTLEVVFGRGGLSQQTPPLHFGEPWHFPAFSLR